MTRFMALAVLPCVLAACAGTEVRDEMPGTAWRPPGPVRTQDYTPGHPASGLQAQAVTPPGPTPGPTPGPMPPAVKPAPPSPTPSSPPPARRRGSSTPPDLLTRPGVPQATQTLPPAPSPAPPPANPIARSNLENEVNRLQQRDSLGRLGPIEQRDLMNKQWELDRAPR